MKKILTMVLVACMLFSMTVPALAANFTPSVSNKPAPGVVPQPDGGSGTINGGGGSSSVPQGGLIITPVSDRNNTNNPEVSDSLNDAYDSIQSADSVGDLPSKDSEGSIQSAIENALSRLGKDLDVKDLVVRDLFDARLTGDYADDLKDGASIDIGFDVDLKPGQTLIVITSQDGENWQVIDPSKVVIKEDGSVVVTLEELGAIAFLVDGAEITINPNAADTVASPQTGEF